MPNAKAKLRQPIRAGAQKRTRPDASDGTFIPARKDAVVATDKPEPVQAQPVDIQAAVPTPAAQRRTLWDILRAPFRRR